MHGSLKKSAQARRYARARVRKDSTAVVIVFGVVVKRVGGRNYGYDRSPVRLGLDVVLDAGECLPSVLGQLPRLTFVGSPSFSSLLDVLFEVGGSLFGDVLRDVSEALQPILETL